MEPSNEERSQDVDNGLTTLPAAEQKETKEILDEIAANAEAAGKQKPEGEQAEELEGNKPDQAKPEEGKPADGDEAGKKKPESEGDDANKTGKKPEARRETQLMPTWVHERAKADWGKREQELMASVEEASKRAPQGEGQGTGDESGSKAEASLAKAAEQIAEKHGITVDLAKDLLSAQRELGTSLPKELVEKLRTVDTLKADAEQKKEEANYNGDFDRLIMPLVQAEYGKDVSPQIIDDIRHGLKELAYNPDFSKVPYSTLYKGEDRFRDLIAPVKRGAEGANGSRPAQNASAAGEDGKPDLSKPLSDSAIRALSPEDFDTYGGNMERWERAQKKQS